MPTGRNFHGSGGRDLLHPSLTIHTGPAALAQVLDPDQNMGLPCSYSRPANPPNRYQLNGQKTQRAHPVVTDQRMVARQPLPPHKTTV